MKNTITARELNDRIDELTESMGTRFDTLATINATLHAEVIRLATALAALTEHVTAMEIPPIASESVSSETPKKRTRARANKDTADKDETETETNPYTEAKNSALPFAEQVKVSAKQILENRKSANFTRNEKLCIVGENDKRDWLTSVQHVAFKKAWKDAGLRQGSAIQALYDALGGKF